MSNVYLQHHGIKGQKWGVRRFQNADGSYTSAGKKRRNDGDGVADAKAAYKSAKRNYNNSFDKAYGKSYQAYSLSKKKRQANEERWNDVSDKAKALDKAKSDYKTAKTNAKKSAVADYNKKYNAAERASNQADKKWKDVNEQYKALGKTRVTRLINAARNKTEAAQKYNKEYDLASAMSDKADAKWREATAAYRKTGRSKAERFLNNVKYDPANIRYKEDKAKAKSEWKTAAEKYGTSNTKAANEAYEKAADKYNADMKAAKKRRWQ